MILLLDHKDSPYIRCIGFLYLRYACEPTQLWKWIHPYLFDEELVRVRFSTASPEIPMGEFVRSLFGELEYFGTRLPRLPLPVERELKDKLLQADLVEERAKRHFANPRTMDYFRTLASRVRAQYEDEQNPLRWYDAVIDRVLTTDPDTNATLRRPKFVVTFPEYGNTEIVSLGDLDLPGEGLADRNRRQGDTRGREYHRTDRSRGEHEHDRCRPNREIRAVVGSGGYCGSRGYNNDRRDRSRSRESNRDLVDRRSRRHESTLEGASLPSAKPSGASTNEPAADHACFLDRSHHLAPSSRQEERGAHPAPVASEKTPQELAAIAEKKRRLANRYG